MGGTFYELGSWPEKKGAAAETSPPALQCGPYRQIASRVTFIHFIILLVLEQ